MAKSNNRRKSRVERNQDHPFDHYPTPTEVVEAALAFLPAPHPGAVVVDPGAGRGVWGQVAKRFWPDIYLIGIDIAFPKAEGYDEWSNLDFKLWVKRREPESVDLVIGNPAYGEEAEPWCWGARRILKPFCHHLFLMALEFLGGQGRGVGLWQVYPPHRTIISSRRIDFTGQSGGDMRNHVLLWWIKGLTDRKPIEWFDYRRTHNQQRLPFAEGKIL